MQPRGSKATASANCSRRMSESAGCVSMNLHTCSYLLGVVRIVVGRNIEEHSHQGVVDLIGRDAVLERQVEMLGRVAQLQILTRTKRTAFVPSSCLRVSFSAPRAKAIAVRPFRGRRSAIGKPLLSAVVLNPYEEIGQQPGGKNYARSMGCSRVPGHGHIFSNSRTVQAARISILPECSSPSVRTIARGNAISLRMFLLTLPSPTSLRGCGEAPRLPPTRTFQTPLRPSPLGITKPFIM